MSNVLALARPEIVALKPYSSARLEAAPQGLLLNANESPWSYTETGHYNRYPLQQPSGLINKLSSLYDIKPEQLLVTRGADEGIDLLIRAFCGAGQDAILTCPPTYDLYQISATIQGVKTLHGDFQELLTAWNPNVKLIFLCSPNNPTGDVIAKTAVATLCQQLADKAIVIVDEAYVEFSQQRSLSSLVAEHDNLVILRTLSKAYGLAGVRCGSIIANKLVIDLLRKILPAYPIPAPVAELVEQVLTAEKLALINQHIETIKQLREQFEVFLGNLSFVKKVHPSQANFVLFEVDNAQQIIQHCMKQGIIIRDRSSVPGLANHLRISIGSPSQMQQLQEVLQRV